MNGQKQKTFSHDDWTTAKALARERLNSGKDENTPKLIINFMVALYHLEVELMDLEREVMNTSSGLSGFNATKRLQGLESRHSELIGEITSAHSAVILNSPDTYDRFREYGANDVPVDQGPTTHYARQRTLEYQDGLLDAINRLEEISARIGSRIDGRRISANSRLVLSISVIALLVSVSSVIAGM